MKHLSSKLGYNERSIVLLAILENILHYVILQVKLVAVVLQCRSPTHPKLILHEVDNVLMEFIHEWPSLFLPQVLEASLKNTTPVRVRREFENATLEGWNETQTIGRHALDKLLHNLAT
jgi:hypothetical protein